MGFISPAGQTSFIPSARPRASRRVASRKLEIWNTLEGWSTGAVFSFGHLFLTPVFNQSPIVTTTIGLRTTGGAFWSSGNGFNSTFSYAVAIYSNHASDNLPSTLIASATNTNLIGQGYATTNSLPTTGTLITNTEFTASISVTLLRGWYWLGFVCYGTGTGGGPATNIELSEVGSADKLSQLNLAYLIGLSSSAARGVVTLATSSLPADLDSRDIQVNTGSPTTTSLRPRSGPPGMRLEYEPL